MNVLLNILRFNKKVYTISYTDTIQFTYKEKQLMKNRKMSLKNIAVTTGISLALLSFAAPLTQQSADAAGSKFVNPLAQIRYDIDDKLNKLDRQFTEENKKAVEKEIQRLPEKQQRVYKDFLNDIIKKHDGKYSPNKPNKPQKFVNPLAQIRYDIDDSLNILNLSFSKENIDAVYKEINRLPEDQQRVYIDFLLDIVDRHAPKIPVNK